MTAGRRIALRSLAAASVAAALVLAGCGTRGPPFALQNISGLMPRLEFQLTNQDGAAVTEQDYRGEVVLLYFGYTHCPDVCPTTLAMLAAAIRRLGPTVGKKVRVLFVTVDPKRDTAAVLKSYVSFFGPEFVGLRGTAEQLLALTKRYRVAYHLEPPGPDGNYTVDHSSAVFIFDGTGRVRLLGSETDHQQAVASDLRRLAAG
ncbi:MAG: SCO family protein [Steroidobacteraceae bacterium]